ncbi:GDSL-type esterase/lipase family protein [Paenibacillus glacialis]|uniref:GDSL-type esterase/lipase family protein n=1 Tax=Paenibacillus glacialis TaxID=494026 RepID=UPI000838802B|nr:GDSL-type esterase/lipase family protein [Paenibacillus glacialis]
MNSSKWIWRSVSIVSIVTTLVLLVGFIYAIKDVNAPQVGTEAIERPSQQLGEGVADSMDSKKEYKIAAIGDSLAKGTGDETGSGFVKRSVEGLAKSSGKKTTLLNNLGINGLTTDGLVTKLDEEGVQYVLKQSDVIILSIGGNDLFQGAQLLSSAKGESETSAGAESTNSAHEVTAEKIQSALPKASAQLKVVLEKIRVINPDSYIVYVGLYNPFGDMKELKTVGNEAVTRWNNVALTTINKYENMTLVPTYDLFTHNLKRYLSSDHFHPNAEGYQQIANRIVQGIQ